MKKTLLATALMAASFSAISAPYIGVEYGIGSTSHNYQQHFISPSIKLDPSLDDGVLSGFIGYSLTPSWAVEFGYSQFDLNDDRSQYTGAGSDATGNYTTENEWNASIKAKQFSLAPVYTHVLNEKWLSKVKMGITYTQYDITNSTGWEKEYHREDIEISGTNDSHSSSSNKLGGFISIGAEYKVIPQLTIGANAKYQIDSFANTASVNLGSTYYF
jgi:accessory colonization factor AcfA